MEPLVYTRQPTNNSHLTYSNSVISEFELGTKFRKQDKMTKHIPYGAQFLLGVALTTLVTMNSYATGNGNPPPGPSKSFDWLATENIGNVLGTIGLALGLLLAVVIYLNGTMERLIKLRTLTKENDALKAQLKKENQETVLNPDKPAAEDPVSKIHWARVHNEFITARRQLSEQLFKVERRANLNLAIGIVISFAAITILLDQLWGMAPQKTEWTDLFVAYFPRALTCIFIEFLGFFFLRLYRASLTEIRSYENDLRELSIRLVAIESAWDQDNSDAPRTKVALEILRKSTSKPPSKEPELSVDPEAALDLLQKLLKILSKKDKDAND